MIMPASHPAISPTMIQAMIPMGSSFRLLLGHYRVRVEQGPLVCVGVEDSWAGEEDEHDNDEDEDRDPDQDPSPKTALTRSARRAWIDIDLTHLLCAPRGVLQFARRANTVPTRCAGQAVLP